MPRKRRFHIPLYNLNVVQSWRVGQVTLRPAGWLESETARLIDRTPDAKKRKLRPYYRSARRVASETGKWATAEVAALDKDEARETVRETVAVLRLFQRRVTLLNLDQQTFGLPDDVFSVLDRHMVLTRDRISTFGWQWYGVIAPWTFTRAMIRQFRADERLSWLERALRKDARNELEGAAMTALAFLNLATVLYPPPIRIAIQALRSSPY